MYADSPIHTKLLTRQTLISTVQQRRMDFGTNIATLLMEITYYDKWELAIEWPGTNITKF